jgi:RNA recognition motif-containing protein
LDFGAVAVAVAPVAPQQPHSHSGRAFTNVFVKNLSAEVSDAQLQAAFAPCGAITSAVVARDAAGVSKRHGFVNFELAEAAVKCIHMFNGSGTLAAAGETIDVLEHLKKSERFPTVAHAKPFRPKVPAVFALFVAACAARHAASRRRSRAPGRRRRRRRRRSARRRKWLC